MDRKISRDSARITNGQPAVIADFPYLVAMIDVAEEDLSGGGSIIGLHWSLISSSLYRQWHTISFDKSSWWFNKSWFRWNNFFVQQYWNHPLYGAPGNARSLEYDIVILRTQPDSPIQGTHVSHVALPPNCPTGNCCNICGGTSGRIETGASSQTLNQLVAPVHDFDDCNRIWGRIGPVFFCKSVSMAVILVESFLLNKIPNSLIINDWANIIRERGNYLYRLGVKRAVDDDIDARGFVEISAIWDERTPKQENVLYLRQNLRVKFETSHTAAVENGNFIELAHYRQSFGDISIRDTLPQYLENRNHAIIFSERQGHYHAADDLQEFVGENERWSLHFLEIIQDGQIDFVLKEVTTKKLEIVDISSNSDEEDDFETIDLISDCSDEEDESIDVDQAESDQGTNEKVDKYHPDAIWASSIDLVEGADDIRDKVENYWFERFFERSREMPMPALENENKCIVEQCGLVASDRRMCSFHRSISFTLANITKGRLCPVENCNRRLSLGMKFCHTHKRIKAKDDGVEITDAMIENYAEDARIIGAEIAEELAEETKKNPKQRKYIGMSCKDLKERLRNHEHKDYSSCRILREFDNLWLLRDVEFETIRQYSALVGTKYLRNVVAGGIYYNHIMNQSGILYVLNFDNEVDPNPDIKGPNQNFDVQDCSKILMRKFGYAIRDSPTEKAYKGNGQYKCDKCNYSTDTKDYLCLHKNRKHGIITRECSACGKTSNSKRDHERHAKSIHGKVVPLNFLCLYSNCELKGFHAIGKSAHFIPDFTPLSKGIIAITLHRCKVLKLNKDDLKPYPKLVYLLLLKNKLRVIEKDVFKYTPDLKYIDIGFNMIKEIVPGAFDNLKNLNELHLLTNECIQKEASDRTAVVKFIEELKEKCIVKYRATVIGRKREEEHRRKRREKTSLWVTFGITFGTCVFTMSTVVGIYFCKKCSLLDKLIPNLLGLSIQNSKLKEITQNDLKQFPKMQHLFIIKNQLAVLENDLLKFNPELIYINFKENLIKTIDSKLFDGLTKLNKIVLLKIECVDKEGAETEGIKEIIDAVKDKCAPQFYNFIIFVLFTNYIINELTGRSQERLPIAINHNNELITGDRKIANIFQSKFLQIVGATSAPLLRFSIYNKQANSCSSIFNFKTIKKSSMIIAINNLQSKKSTGIDRINSTLIKCSSNNVASHLTNIFNKMVKDSIYPSQLKTSLVIPIHKSGNRLATENYRPISLLSDFDKIFESLIYDQLNSYLSTNDLLDKYQFGFVAGKGCLDAVCSLLNFISTHVDKGTSVLVISLDIAKAFDSVNHELLLTKLKLIGISDKSIDLLRSFLTERIQIVSYNGLLSKPGLITKGVPQGSKLGPLLFNLLINDLRDITSHSKLFKYADDVIMALPLSNHLEKDAKVNVKMLLNDINSLAEFYSNNDLNINRSKSKALIIGNILDHELIHYLNENDIENCEKIKYLGLLIDCKLKFLPQVENIARSMTQGIAALRHMSDNTNIRNMIIFYHAHIQSHLMFCTFILLRCRSIDINRLQTIQNSALKIIFKLPRLYHTQDLFSEHATKNKILSVIGCIYYSAIMMVKKSLNSTDKSLPHIRKGSSTRNNNVILSIAKTKILQDDITSSGCILYNQLPSELKTISNVFAFKTELKSFLLARTKSLLKHSQFNERNFFL
ncbi:hypothetical protein PVAND_015681 [Polypedilum vanderplanki]|uniref:Reverse transcriptase domain-containing protein n=1 Tax=Polypedilum vanderplanki TaxID=319348 RepID=A0A9J6BDU1_POLVA|nr:hypothetical protein PVAND_015681 [Polypedilum vanderplanki]